MAEKAFVPAEFAHLVNLADDVLGTFVVYATDDYFAEKENLLKPGAPQWLEGKYTDRGKWMDGWESQRKREPGHDFVIVRLGVPGRLEGLLVDTTHFKGNAPQAVSLEVIEAPDDWTPARLLAAPVAGERPVGWREVLPETPVRPDFPNVIPLEGAGRATHVRLRIYPDGGVARLRVYGSVEPDDAIYWQPASIDLAAVENGGTVAAVSDQFFGPPSNLLLPGRGVNMGDGWETKRRRTPGSDWAVIRLGRRGVVERIELDTHFFKGNAPQATVIEALDASAIDDETLKARLAGGDGWDLLLERAPLVQHRRHVLQPDRPLTVTHLRVHIFPHGGVNRLRLYGHAVDTAGEGRALAALNEMAGDDVRALFASFNGARAFAEGLLEGRPFPSVRALFAAAEQAWWRCTTDDRLEAFAAHPRIGSSQRAETQTERSASWSVGEQAGVRGADDAVKARLAELNDAYFDRFGFIFIVCASGKSAAEMLALLEARIGRDREAEIETAAREQAKITRLRIGKWLRQKGI